MAQLQTIPLDQIDLPATLLRSHVDELAVRELAESIRELGLLQPIGVVAAGGRYTLHFGHTRLLAHRYLGRPYIDALVLSPEQALAIEQGAAENIQRRDLTPVEEARAIRNMHDSKGRSVREIAAALGKSDSWVRARLEILLWPADVVELVARKELTPAVARELVLVEDEPVRAIYTRAAVENGVTAAQMRLWRQEWESRRAFQPSGTPADISSVPTAIPTVPLVACALCLTAHPITTVQFLRLCPACVHALDDARRSA